MKLLLDTCVWGGTAREIEAAGHDVKWVGNWDADPGDDEILAHAHDEGRVLVTLDKDFGTLAVVFERPHAGIIRLVNVPARTQASMCLTIIGRHAEDLSKGAIVTAEADKLRIRPGTPSDEES